MRHHLALQEGPDDLAKGPLVLGLGPHAVHGNASFAGASAGPLDPASWPLTHRCSGRLAGSSRFGAQLFPSSFSGSPGAPALPVAAAAASLTVGLADALGEPFGAPAVNRGTEAPAPSDRNFPALHGRPRSGWLNDPNGLAHVDGRYHVFFQYNPASPVHDAIGWGHASSADLLIWDQEPVALAPTPGGPDAYGCWTGVVTEVDGVPTAFYSGVADASTRSTVLAATSDRTLRSWSKSDRVVAGVPDDPDLTTLRDPFLLRAAGRLWAVQGAGFAGGTAGVVAYSCEDPLAWTYRGPVATSADPVCTDLAAARVWECPQLFPLGERWVLIVSPLRDGPDPGRLVPHRVVALVGDLRPAGDGLRFEAAGGNPVDDGPDFYAPQVLLLPGRVLMWGWSWERGRSPDQLTAAGWAGTLTFARELYLRNDTLCSRPDPALAGLRRERVRPDGSGALPAGLGAFEAVSLDGSGAQLLLVTGGGAGQVVSNLRAAGTGVLVDGSIVETFTPDGAAHTSRWYPDRGGRWVVRGPGAVEVRRLGVPLPPGAKATEGAATELAVGLG